MRNARFQIGLLLALLLSGGTWGCAPSPAPAPLARLAPARASTPFSCLSTEGQVVDSRSTRGRATAVLFVTTYDLASQVQARQLSDLLRRHRPRANGVAIVLESAEYGVLAEAFRTTLKLGYPVCLADPDTRQGIGPFGRLDRVPTLVLLDREGVEVFRREGLVPPRDVKKALAAATSDGQPFGP